MKYLEGYIAIISVLIVSFVSLGLLAVISINSVYVLKDQQNNLDSSDIDVLLNNCIEESLMQLNLDKEVIASYTIDGVVCTTSNLNNSGDNWTYTLTVFQDNYSYSANVDANRTDKVYLNRIEYQK